jgi:hypothetical protein
VLIRLRSVCQIGTPLPSLADTKRDQNEFVPVWKQEVSQSERIVNIFLIDRCTCRFEMSKAEGASTVHSPVATLRDTTTLLDQRKAGRLLRSSLLGRIELATLPGSKPPRTLWMKRICKI